MECSVANGFLNVYKPAGMSSHQVVQRIRRLTHERHVGHAGTLDPDATGVLPVALGQFTRLLEWAVLTPKVYRAAIVLGRLTHTGDRAGDVVGESGAPFPDRHALENILPWLTGTIWQFPPQVSALKQGGQRSYHKVRQGQTVWLDPRPIEIEAIKVLDGVGDRWYVEAVVGSGTYIRALARDVGFLLGHAASLESLERTQVGAFSAQDAWRLDDLEANPNQWQDALVAGTQMLSLSTWPVTADQAAMLWSGNVAGIPPLPGSGPTALVYEKQIVAVVDGPPWHFRKVLVKGER